MKYMGSKARIAKHIIPILASELEPGMTYVEPFVGGANVIDKMPKSNTRIGIDNNKYLIEMFRALQRGVTFMQEIDKSVYDTARDVYNGRETGFNHLMEMDDATVGWIGFMASANGRFFDGGYSGKSYTKIGTVRDYVAESIRNIRKQDISGIHFHHGDYASYPLPDRSLIYCDPPYADSKKYDTSRGFDHAKFHEWCRKMCREGHKVFVSEYSMPDDFTCVWSMDVSSSLRANAVISGRKISTEKLFTIGR